MPRNRNRNTPISLVEDLEQDFTPTYVRISAPTPVDDFLKNNYFDMMKELNRKIECPICMEEICCKNCFTLLKCGHHLHLHELMKCSSCPVCRQ